MTSIPGRGDRFTPRYVAIEQELRARVASLKPHDALPSDAELCTEFRVSRMTARAAVKQLVEEEAKKVREMADHYNCHLLFSAWPGKKEKEDRERGFALELRITFFIPLYQSS